MDGGPFSAVIAESQVVGRHKVAPEKRQHDRNMLNLEMKDKFIHVFVYLLIQGVSSLGYDPCKLCIPASIYLKPVNPVLWVCTPCPTSHVILILRALGTTETKKHAAEYQRRHIYSTNWKKICTDMQAIEIQMAWSKRSAMVIRTILISFHH